MPVILISSLERLSSLHRRQKQLVVALIDLILLLLSIWIAYSLRIGIWLYWGPPIHKLIIGTLGAMVPAFYLTGVYRAIFRFAGVGMLRTMVHAFAIYTAITLLLFSFIGFAGVPRTLGLLQPLTFFCLVAASRMAFRFLLVDVLGRTRFGGQVHRVLIYGAGFAGQRLCRALHSDPTIRVLGFVDDDKRLDRQKLDGYRVFSSEFLEEVIKRKAITDVLLAMPKLSNKRRLAIVQQLSKYSVEVRKLPEMKDIVGGSVSFSDVPPLDIADLLGREPVRPNELLLGRTIVGGDILVTGAGGSIGSELCRQIVAIGARKLILVELSEHALYEVDCQVRALATQMGKLGMEIVPLLGSVADPERIHAIFGEHRPQTVFHAAAYKHVPLVEANPLEAIRNNVFGTLYTAQAAESSGVRDFILISTDKAVRPTNVMGATKRIAEQILQGLTALGSETRFSMVRFGNVLGSSGSVVPLFQRQIAQGGPITLTHKDITRFFMTIPEAANLVIQAAGLAKGGEVFLLDMGKPIKIGDLAATMIQLSGLKVRSIEQPDGDIEIIEIGLRPGEKLYEELLIGENPQTTKHPRIMMARESHLDWPVLSNFLSVLSECQQANDAIRMLNEAVPEFRHRRDDVVDLSATLPNSA